jgi:hypothetical protein
MEIKNIINSKREGESPLERLRCKLEDNIKIDLKVVGYEGVDCE